MNKHLVLAISASLWLAGAAVASGIDVEKLAPIADLAESVDCAALATACRCSEKADPPGGVNPLGDGRGLIEKSREITAGGLEGAIAICERSIASRLDDYSSDLKWARILVAGTGSPRTACMMNQLADAGFPGGRQALWDALGLDSRHWRRGQDVCWKL